MVVSVFVLTRLRRSSFEEIRSAKVDGSAVLLYIESNFIKSA
jgi:hypothetical protein